MRTFFKPTTTGRRIDGQSCSTNDGSSATFENLFLRSPQDSSFHSPLLLQGANGALDASCGLRTAQDTPLLVDALGGHAVGPRGHPVFANTPPVPGTAGHAVGPQQVGTPPVPGTAGHAVGPQQVGTPVKLFLGRGARRSCSYCATCTIATRQWFSAGIDLLGGETCTNYKTVVFRRYRPIRWGDLHNSYKTVVFRRY